MGLVSWLVNRRAQKESAAAAAVQAGAGSVPADDVYSIHGLAGIGTLMSQWQQFQQAAGPAGMQQVHQAFDLRGSGAREEILAALQKHGVATQGTQVFGMGQAVQYDPDDMMALQGDILGVLAKHGINFQQMGVQVVPGMQPAKPTPAADLPPIQDPLS